MSTSHAFAVHNKLKQGDVLLFFLKNTGVG
jgi:hypothetical protein